jgi:hypothetical protein
MKNIVKALATSGREPKPAAQRDAQAVPSC